MNRGREIPMVYISGPITGVDPVKRREQFAAAEKHIRDFGGRPINPLMIAQMYPGLGYEDYMRIDIALLNCCDEIYLLNGFAGSDGCMRELTVARSCRIRIRTQIDEERVANR